VPKRRRITIKLIIVTAGRAPETTSSALNEEFDQAAADVAPPRQQAPRIGEVEWP
jgi:hypothetical protein